MTDDHHAWALLLGQDAVVARKLSAVLDEWRLALALPGTEGAGEPALVVCPVDNEDALTELSQWRARWPRALLVAYLSMPDAPLWRSAQQSGCDLVTSRGGLGRSVRALLDERSRGERPRFPVVDLADAAGRLGLITSLDETPVGPVALYRLDGRWCAVGDRCPHAGARLSEGVVEGSVLTCPWHGSQFDLRSGERLRGPADQELASYSVVEDRGQLWLEVPPQGGG